ncbi:MAG: HAD family phosphatase [Nitrospirota bacterium]|nr:HAD family phosphatase [Nitrospirota bacterium]MDE3243849.1 HAD family phosphatase [Nitrospirota bacterium]
MMRAIIFDFDGVVADNEPIHYAMFHQVLGEIGLPFTEADYYAKYLGFDDKGCFAAVLAAQGRPAPPELIHDLIDRKARAYLAYIRDHLVIFPGVRELVREAATRHRLAIASGALRHEIEFILEQAGIRKEFEHITSAEDVQQGKPSPEGYLHALAALNRRTPAGQNPLAPADCLVIEDSIPGIQAAHAAGMKVLAVANTHHVQDLREADAITHSLADVNLTELESRLWKRGTA